MARDEGAGAGSILLAFMLGAVSGAAVALLYAPTSGRETREFLGDKAREGRDKAAEATERGRQALNQGRDTLAHAIERGREAYQARHHRRRDLADRDCAARRPGGGGVAGAPTGQGHR